MRGRYNSMYRDPAQARNTPAYAGKILITVRVLPCSRKHPRVCGEDPKLSLSMSSKMETPPRMRGRSSLRDRKQKVCGNTPAYAGKMKLITLKQTDSRKHPRVCGEDCLIRTIMIRSLETPPRMRGRYCLSFPYTPRKRNTPAYAGKIWSVPPLWSRSEKHPRVCGEDQSAIYFISRKLETPPRMRGRCVTRT